MLETPLKLLLVEDNPGDARLVREMLSEAEGQAFEVHWVDNLLAALESLARDSFDVVLTDLSLPDSQGLEAFNAIQSHAPGMPVVVLTGLDDERAALGAVQGGAQDYFVKGRLNSESLARALRYAVIRQVKSSENHKTESEKATLFGILSVKGGVGATTLACHFATELKHQTQQDVLLVDLDVSSLAAGFLMGVTSPHTIIDAAQNLNRLDASLWKGVVCHTGEGIDLVQSPGTVRFGDEISGERVRHVVRFVRPLYRWIVVDLGKLTTVSMNVLTEINEVFVVATYELPALREASRVLKKLLELGFSANRVHLVINRMSKVASMSSHDLEKALGFPIHALIPDCSADLYEAYSEGRFLDRRLQMHKHAAQLVTRYLGLQPEPSRSGLKRLLFANV